MNRVGVTEIFRAFCVSVPRLTLAISLAVAPALPLAWLSAAQAQTAEPDQAAPAPAAKPKPKPRAKPAAAPAAAPANPAERWDLNLKSEPPGALAKAANGGSCTTPCALNLPRADTSVTFTLAGYLPQVIPIKWLPAMFHYEMYERTDQGIAVYPVDFSPNPAVAQLVSNGKPKPAPKTAAKKKDAPGDAAPQQ